MEQLQENIRTFQESKPLNESEMDELFSIAKGMVQKLTVSCTECRYCLTHCPKRLDIPYLLSLYNEHCFTTSGGRRGNIAPMALAALPEERRPATCVSCRECESVCPQQIKISEAMADFVERLG
jgi:hypothetical protein